MVGSGMQPPVRQAEVNAADLGTDQEGSRCTDIGADLLGGGTIGTAILVRDMDPDTEYAKVAGRNPP